MPLCSVIVVAMWRQPVNLCLRIFDQSGHIITRAIVRKILRKIIGCMQSESCCVVKMPVTPQFNVWEYRCERGQMGQWCGAVSRAQLVASREDLEKGPIGRHHLSKTWRSIS